MPTIEKRYDYFPKGKPQFPDERDKWNARIGVVMSYELDRYDRPGPVEWRLIGTRTALTGTLVDKLNRLAGREDGPNGREDLVESRW